MTLDPLLLAFALILGLMMLCIAPVTGKKAGGSGVKAPTRQQTTTKKRILSELRELTSLGLLLDQPFNTTRDECGIRLSPMKDNFFCWHFSMTGVEGSHFEGGIYHGRIFLHPEYPRKAPTICMHTPNGRWEVNKEICLSASAHHPELWDPKWNLRTLVLSLRSFMLTHPREIGGIHTRPETQKALAQSSKSFICRTCGVNHAALAPGSQVCTGNVHNLRVISSGSLRLRKGKNKSQEVAPSTLVVTAGETSPKGAEIHEILRDRAMHKSFEWKAHFLSIVRMALTLFMLALAVIGRGSVHFTFSL
jgi:ubiquitin-protein ligase